MKLGLEINKHGAYGYKYTIFDLDDSRLKWLFHINSKYEMKMQLNILGIDNIKWKNINNFHYGIVDIKLFDD